MHLTCGQQQMPATKRNKSCRFSQNYSACMVCCTISHTDSARFYRPQRREVAMLTTYHTSAIVFVKNDSSCFSLPLAFVAGHMSGATDLRDSMFDVACFEKPDFNCVLGLGPCSVPRSTFAVCRGRRLMIAPFSFGTVCYQHN